MALPRHSMYTYSNGMRIKKPDGYISLLTFTSVEALKPVVAMRKSVVNSKYKETLYQHEFRIKNIFPTAQTYDYGLTIYVPNSTLPPAPASRTCNYQYDGIVIDYDNDQVFIGSGRYIVHVTRTEYAVTIGKKIPVIFEHVVFKFVSPEKIIIRGTPTYQALLVKKELLPLCDHKIDRQNLHVINEAPMVTANLNGSNSGSLRNVTEDKVHPNQSAPGHEKRNTNYMNSALTSDIAGFAPIYNTKSKSFATSAFFDKMPTGSINYTQGSKITQSIATEISGSYPSTQKLASIGELSIPQSQTPDNILKCCDLQSSSPASKTNSSTLKELKTVVESLHSPLSESKTSIIETPTSLASKSITSLEETPNMFTSHPATSSVETPNPAVSQSATSIVKPPTPLASASATSTYETTTLLAFQAATSTTESSAPPSLSSISINENQTPLASHPLPSTEETPTPLASKILFPKEKRSPVASQSLVSPVEKFSQHTSQSLVLTKEKSTEPGGQSTPLPTETIVPTSHFPDTDLKKQALPTSESANCNAENSSTSALQKKSPTSNNPTDSVFSAACSGLENYVSFDKPLLTIDNETPNPGPIDDIPIDVSSEKMPGTLDRNLLSQVHKILNVNSLPNRNNSAIIISENSNRLFVLHDLGNVNSFSPDNVRSSKITRQSKKVKRKPSVKKCCKKSKYGTKKRSFNSGFKCEELDDRPKIPNHSPVKEIKEINENISVDLRSKNTEYDEIYEGDHKSNCYPISVSIPSEQIELFYKHTDDSDDAFAEVDLKDYGSDDDIRAVKRSNSLMGNFKKSTMKGSDAMPYSSIRSLQNFRSILKKEANKSSVIFDQSRDISTIQDATKDDFVNSYFVKEIQSPIMESFDKEEVTSRRHTMSGEIGNTSILHKILEKTRSLRNSSVSSDGATRKSNVNSTDPEKTKKPCVIS